MNIKHGIIRALGGYTGPEYREVWNSGADGIAEITRLELALNESKVTYSVCSKEIGQLYKERDKLTAELRSLQPFNAVQPLATCTYKDVKTVLKKLTRNYEVLDEFYSVPTMTELKAFLKHDETNRIPWTKRFDCDDHALQLWANAKRWNSMISIGKCHIELNNGGKHAINIAIVQDGYVFIEPQLDRVYEWYPNCRKVYRVEM